jgi:hypothetical protein
MKRVVTAANNVVFEPADANAWQDLTQGLTAGNKNGDLNETLVRGVDARVWQPTAGGIANGTIVLIDDTRDWRDCMVKARVLQAGAASITIGHAAGADHTIATSTFFDTWGYTGLGAEKAAGGAVSAGNPPVNTGAVGSPASWYVKLNAAPSLFLYVSKVDNGLYIYNGAGLTVWPILWLEAFHAHKRVP